MTEKYSGGCSHVHVTSSAEPVDNHECHCNVCKTVTKQHTTHVAFFNYGDLKVDHPEKIKRVPFNANNPGGPLEICLCTECNSVLMLDDKLHRIRVSACSRSLRGDARSLAAIRRWLSAAGNTRSQNCWCGLSRSLPPQAGNWLQTR